MRTSPLHDARVDVRIYGFITSSTAARLEALGHDVGALERRLLEAR